MSVRRLIYQHATISTVAAHDVPQVDSFMSSSGVDQDQTTISIVAAVDNLRSQVAQFPVHCDDNVLISQPNASFPRASRLVTTASFCPSSSSMAAQ